MTDRQTHETAVTLLGVALNGSLTANSNSSDGRDKSRPTADGAGSGGSSRAGSGAVGMPTQPSTTSTRKRELAPSAATQSAATALRHRPHHHSGASPDPALTPRMPPSTAATAMASPSPAPISTAAKATAHGTHIPIPGFEYHAQGATQATSSAAVFAQHQQLRQQRQQPRVAGLSLPQPPPNEKQPQVQMNYEQHLQQLKALKQQEMQRQHEIDLRQHHAQALAGAMAQQQQQQQHAQRYPTAPITQSGIQQPQPQPQSLLKTVHRSESASLAPAVQGSASASTAPAAAPSPSPPTPQQQDNIVLAMSSIGFGIDSSGSGSLGDATEASVKALKDAMERSALRLPITSSTNHSLEIKVQLGIPPKQTGSLEPMMLDQNKIVAILPTAFPILPIKVVLGGLFIPSVGLQTPAICTAVACITLQSRSVALVSPLTPSPPPAPVAEQPVTRRHSVQVPLSATRNEHQWSPPNVSVTNQTTTQTPVEFVRASNRTATPLRAHRSMSVGSSLGQANPAPASGMVASASTPSLAVSEALAKLQAAAASASNSHVPLPPTRSSSIASGMSSGSNGNSSANAKGTSNSIDMLAAISEEVRKAAESNSQSAAAPANAIKQDPMPQAATNPATAALQQIECGVSSQQFNSTNGPVVNADEGQALHGFTASMEMGSSSSINSDDQLAAMLRHSNNCNYNYKKLPPGVTTKNNQRLFVRHKYRDHSGEVPLSEEQDLMMAVSASSRTPNAAFPLKLHETLSLIEANGHSDIIGWMPHGRSFKIHKQKEFAEIILPQYFVMTKKSSFLRQLNLYGFNRFSAGADQGSYYHEKFLRGMKFLTRRMIRLKVNGNRIRSAGNPDEEPVLSEFPACPVRNIPETNQMMANGTTAPNAMQVHSFTGPSMLMSIATIAANQSAANSGNRFGYVSRDEETGDDRETSSSTVNVKSDG